MIELMVTALAVAVVVIGPFAVFAYLALRFGADSRPGIGDTHRRRFPAPGR